MKYILLITIMALQGLVAQEVKVQGRFLADTMQLGQKVRYSLRVEFPFEAQLLMPDSTANFAPFKLLAVHTFNSRLHKDIQIDSVVYELSSFALDSVQSLRLPVYAYVDADSTSHYTLRDSVILVKPALQEALLSDESHYSLYLKFNYQMWLAGFGLGVLLLYLLYKAFYKRIQTYGQRIMMRRRFKKHISTHNLLFKELQHAKQIETLEKIIGNWKETLSEISGKPISTYTSKEINQIYQDPKLYEALRNLDKAIYSKAFLEELYVDVEIIYNSAKREFVKKNRKNG